MRFSHSHFPNRIFAFQIGFSRLISDFRVSYRIFVSHIGFWRLISDFGVSFSHHFSKSYFRASNWIAISHFQIEFQFVPQSDARRLYDLLISNRCGSPPRCRAHDLEDKTAPATVNVRGWSAAVMSFELDSKLVTPLLIIMSQEIADGLQFSCSSQLFQVIIVLSASLLY